MTGNGWRSFELLPSDVLFFRDGKPSTLGTDHYLRSLFPPFPSTLYGAVRTRRLLDEGVALEGLVEANWQGRLDSLTGEVGSWGRFGSLELRGPWLVRNGEALLPAPADLGITLACALRSKEERPKIAQVVRFRPAGEENGRSWSHPLALLSPFIFDGQEWQPWTGAEPRTVAGEWFLTTQGLSAWRQGGTPEPADFVHRTELWCDEARTGVGLQKEHRTSEKGRLYTFGFIRLRSGVSLGFDVKGSELQPGGFVRLGGEGRTASLQAGPAFPAFEGAPAGGRFSLCFATPALSETGGYPPGFAADRLEGILGGRRCRLVGAALSRFVLAGGWDLARQFPKPLRRAIPAGSVFLFEPLEDAASSLAGLDGHCFSDFPGEELARQGFGLAAAGLSR
ncbi:MAG: type III-B CRISPR module-associated Cmr3 family protein [Thermoanaerobaculia bacterium]